LAGNDAQYSFFKKNAGSWKGCCDGIAEFFAEFKRACADGQLEGCAGEGFVEFLCQGK
jgi:hypothetical protein